MTTKTYKIPFGKGEQIVNLPVEKVIYDIHGNKATTLDDMAKETLRAIRNPIDSEPLAKVVTKGDIVAIVVSDLTRLVRTKDFLPTILDELNTAGIEDKDIRVVVATGTHRGHTEEENIEVYGKEVVDRVKIYQHDCKAEDLVFMGTTSRGTPVWIDNKVATADKVIVTGGVSLHPFAGFGGGRKGILPGVSGIKSVNHNHLLALTDEVGGGCNEDTICSKTIGNRVNEDMVEACGIVNPSFLVNVVFTPDGDLHEVVAGNWKTAYEKGCKDLLEMSAVEIKKQGDIVIASAGGSPKDTNLYQGTKAHMNADFALKEGGILIGVMECPDIKEPPIFSNWISMEGSLLDMENAVRNDFSIPAFVAFKTRCIINKCSAAYLVTKKENFDFVKKTGQVPVETVEEAYKLAEEEMEKQGKKDFEIIVMGHAGATLPIVKA